MVEKKIKFALSMAKNGIHSLEQTSLSYFKNLQFQHSLFCGLCNRFSSFFLCYTTERLQREKLIEFRIISEFNTDLVLNDEEVTLKPNKLINFIFFRDTLLLDKRSRGKEGKVSWNFEENPLYCRRKFYNFPRKYTFLFCVRFEMKHRQD
jgi:hypothetical protein